MRLKGGAGGGARQLMIKVKVCNGRLHIEKCNQSLLGTFPWAGQWWVQVKWMEGDIFYNRNVFRNVENATFYLP